MNIHTALLLSFSIYNLASCYSAVAQSNEGAAKVNELEELSHHLDVTVQFPGPLSEIDSDSKEEIPSDSSVIRTVSHIFTPDLVLDCDNPFPSALAAINSCGITKDYLIRNGPAIMSALINIASVFLMVFALESQMDNCGGPEKPLYECPNSQEVLNRLYVVAGFHGAGNLASFVADRLAGVSFCSSLLIKLLLTASLALGFLPYMLNPIGKTMLVSFFLCTLLVMISEVSSFHLRIKASNTRVES